MKKINLIALLAAFMLAGGVISCKNNETPVEPEVPGPVVPEPDPTPDPTPTPDPEPEPEPVKKGTVKVVNHGLGETIIGEHSEEIGSTVEVFARPKNGYEPFAKVNDEAIELVEGNGSFVLNEGENIVDVEYKNIRPVHTKTPEKFDEAFKQVLERISFDRNDVIEKVSENEFALKFSLNGHQVDKMLELDLNEITLNFNKTKPNCVNIEITNFLSLISDIQIKYSIEIDPYTFNPYGDPVPIKKITQISGSNEIDITNTSEDYITKFKANVNNFIDLILTNFYNDYVKNFGFKYELYDLGFSYYPKRYKVNHIYKEYVGLSRNYAKGLATAMNYLEANSNSYMNTVFGGYGIREAALIDSYGTIEDAVLLKFDDFIRFCFADGMPINGSTGTSIYILDIPFKSSNKINIHGFSNYQDEYHKSADTDFALAPYLECKFNFDLDITKPFTYETTKLVDKLETFIEPWAIYPKGGGMIYAKVDTKFTEAGIKNFEERLLYALKCVMANNRPDILDFNRFNFETNGSIETVEFYKGVHYVPSVEAYEAAHKTFYEKMRKLIREGAGSTLEETAKVTFTSADLQNLVGNELDINGAEPTFVGVEENGKFNVGFKYEIPGEANYKVSLTYPDKDLTNYNTRISYEIYDEKLKENFAYVYDINALTFRRLIDLRGKEKQIPVQELNVELKGAVEKLPEAEKVPVSGTKIYYFETGLQNLFTYIINNICEGDEILSTGYRSLRR